MKIPLTFLTVLSLTGMCWPAPASVAGTISPDIQQRWSSALGGADYLQALKATGMAGVFTNSGAGRGPIPKDAQKWTFTGPRGGFGPQGDAAGRVCGVELVQIGTQTFVYAGASSGGLWRSDITNMGVWESLGDSLPNPSVRTIAVHPANPLRIIVGTGDYGRYKGAGLFLTTDGGATWNAIPMDPVPHHCFRVRQALGNPQVMLAASDTGLWRSQSSGDQWTQSLAGNWTDLVLHPTDANVMYAVQRGAGIFQSTNQGVNWTQLTSPNLPPSATWGRASLAICRDAPNNVAITVEYLGHLLGVYRTRDGGGTWANVTGTLPTTSSDFGQGSFCQALAFRPNNPDELFLGMVTIARSASDGLGGLSWTIGDASGIRVGHPDFAQLAFSSLSGDNLLWMSSDGGLDFHAFGVGTLSANGNAGSGLAVSQVDGLDANRNVMAVGLIDNGTLGTADRGANWTLFGGGDGASVQITDPQNAEVWWWTGVFSAPPYWHIMRTWVGGPSQDVLTLTDSIATFYYDPDGAKMWCASDKKIYSTPVSATPVYWTERISGGLHNVASYSLRVMWGSKIESGTLAVSYGGALAGDVAVAHLQGGNWTINITTNLVPNPPSWWVRGMTPSPEWPGEWWACLHSPVGQPKVLHTTDYGQTWADISGTLTNLETVTAVVPRPFQPLTLYAATSLGVLRSLDGGRSWVPFQEGLPIVELHGLAFAVDPTHVAAHTLVAGTYGRGTWTRDIPGPPIIYVDLNNTSGVEDGTFEHPYSTIAKGIAAAPPQAIVAGRANTYLEPQVIRSAVTLKTYVGSTVVR